MKPRKWTRRYPDDREQKALNRIRRYEELKRAWISEHPDATPAEYTAAMNAFAKRCSV